MFVKRVLALIVLSVVASASVALGQGAQTGTISGTVRSTDGLTLPGATVTATSANQQGPVVAVSDLNGVYFLKGLAPGSYRVEIGMPGFATVVRDDVQVRVGGMMDVGAVLAVAGVNETVLVTASAPARKRSWTCWPSAAVRPTSPISRPA
jgi:hypothetical protein